ncbi:MAG: efflux RND transporter periplasmic adaptor subunit [Xanthomonadales bacterium]|nr:efflux RND transporter periplasmic adaptor subunit [Xanthomonadales bacterium]
MSKQTASRQHPGIFALECLRIPVVAAMGFSLFISSAPAPAQQPAPQAVSALGRLEPEHGIIRVAAASTPQAVSGALLVELHVEEGDDVERGQLLAVLDTAAVFDAMVRHSEVSLQYAQREVDAARSKAEEACVRAKVARQEAERRTRLQAQGVAGEEEAERARGEAEAQAAACANAQTAISLTETGVEVARAHLAQARVEAERARVRAPIDGRVLDVVKRPGELVEADGILELGKVSRMYAIAEVYETDIRRVRTGQRATVSSAALDRDLEGVVSSIRPKVEKQDEIGTDPAARKDARIVEVDILLDEPGAAAGLTNLQVDVVIQP